MKAYRLQISVRGAEPAISRIVDIPDHACFHDLHSVIQSVMGWVDCMDYDFTVDDILIGPYEVDEGILNDLETALSDFGGAPIAYRYNLEDPWAIDIEWKGSVDDHPHGSYPPCSDGTATDPSRKIPKTVREGSRSTWRAS